MKQGIDPAETLVKLLNRTLGHREGVAVAREGDLVFVSTAGQTHALLAAHLVGGESWRQRYADTRDLSATVRASPVLVAPDAPVRLRRELTTAGINWVDGRGNAEVVTESGLVLNLRVETAVPGLGSEYGWPLSALALGEVLLSCAADSTPLPPLARLVEMSGISKSQVSKLLSEFDARGWTRKEGGDRGALSRRVVQDAPGLLDGWASGMGRRQDPTIHAHALWHNPYDFVMDSLLPQLAGAVWCVSGEMAAEVVAPYSTVPPQRVLLYVHPKTFDTRLGSILEEAGCRISSTRARVEVRRAGQSVLSLAQWRSGDRFPVVGDHRVYADLLHEGGVRSGERAEHFRSECIGF